MMPISRNPERVELERVTADIQRFTGQFFYGESVGNYLVCEEDQIILIEAPSYSPAIAALVESFRLPTRIFLTHAATSNGGDQWQSAANIGLYLNELDFEDEWLRASPAHSFNGDFQISEHLHAFHLPAHSAGHTAFYDDRAGGTLFSGDAILLKNGKLKIDLIPECIPKLLNLKFERLLPLHYAPILADADKMVHQFLRERTR